MPFVTAISKKPTAALSVVCGYFVDEHNKYVVINRLQLLSLYRLKDEENNTNISENRYGDNMNIYLHSNDDMNNGQMSEHLIHVQDFDLHCSVKYMTSVPIIDPQTSELIRHVLFIFSTKQESAIVTFVPSSQPETPRQQSNSVFEGQEKSQNKRRRRRKVEPNTMEQEEEYEEEQEQQQEEQEEMVEMEVDKNMQVLRMITLFHGSVDGVVYQYNPGEVNLICATPTNCVNNEFLEQSYVYKNILFANEQAEEKNGKGKSEMAKRASRPFLPPFVVFAMVLGEVYLFDALAAIGSYYTSHKRTMRILTYLLPPLLLAYAEERGRQPFYFRSAFHSTEFDVRDVTFGLVGHRSVNTAVKTGHGNSTSVSVIPVIDTITLYVLFADMHGRVHVSEYEVNTGVVVVTEVSSNPLRFSSNIFDSVDNRLVRRTILQSNVEPTASRLVISPNGIFVLGNQLATFIELELTPILAPNASLAMRRNNSYNSTPFFGSTPSNDSQSLKRGVLPFTLHSQPPPPQQQQRHQTLSFTSLSQQQQQRLKEKEQQQEEEEEQEINNKSLEIHTYSRKRRVITRELPTHYNVAAAPLSCVALTTMVAASQASSSLHKNKKHEKELEYNENSSTSKNINKGIAEHVDDALDDNFVLDQYNVSHKGAEKQEEKEEALLLCFENGAWLRLLVSCHRIKNNYETNNNDNNTDDINNDYDEDINNNSNSINTSRKERNMSIRKEFTLRSSREARNASLTPNYLNRANQSWESERFAKERQQEEEQKREEEYENEIEIDFYFTPLEHMPTLPTCVCPINASLYVIGSQYSNTLLVECITSELVQTSLLEQQHLEEYYEEEEIKIRTSVLLEHCGPILDMTTVNDGPRRSVVASTGVGPAGGLSLIRTAAKVDVEVAIPLNSHVTQFYCEKNLLILCSHVTPRRYFHLNLPDNELTEVTFSNGHSLLPPSSEVHLLALHHVHIEGSSSVKSTNTTYEYNHHNKCLLIEHEQRQQQEEEEEEYNVICDDGYLYSFAYNAGMSCLLNLYKIKLCEKFITFATFLSDTLCLVAEGNVLELLSLKRECVVSTRTDSTINDSDTSCKETIAVLEHRWYASEAVSCVCALNSCAFAYGDWAGSVTLCTCDVHSSEKHWHTCKIQLSTTPHCMCKLMSVCNNSSYNSNLTKTETTSQFNMSKSSEISSENKHEKICSEEKSECEECYLVIGTLSGDVCRVRVTLPLHNTSKQHSLHQIHTEEESYNKNYKTAQMTLLQRFFVKHEPIELYPLDEQNAVLCYGEIPLLILFHDHASYNEQQQYKEPLSAKSNKEITSEFAVVDMKHFEITGLTLPGVSACVALPRASSSSSSLSSTPHQMNPKRYLLYSKQTESLTFAVIHRAQRLNRTFLPLHATVTHVTHVPGWNGFLVVLREQDKDALLYVPYIDVERPWGQSSSSGTHNTINMFTTNTTTTTTKTNPPHENSKNMSTTKMKHASSVLSSNAALAPAATTSASLSRKVELLENERCVFATPIFLNGDNSVDPREVHVYSHSQQMTEAIHYVVLVGTAVTFAEEQLSRFSRISWYVCDAEEVSQMRQVGWKDVGGALQCGCVVPNYPGRIALGINGCVLLLHWSSVENNFVVEDRCRVGFVITKLIPQFSVEPEREVQQEQKKKEKNLLKEKQTMNHLSDSTRIINDHDEELMFTDNNDEDRNDEEDEEEENEETNASESLARKDLKNQTKLENKSFHRHMSTLIALDARHSAFYLSVDHIEGSVKVQAREAQLRALIDGVLLSPTSVAVCDDNMNFYCLKRETLTLRSSSANNTGSSSQNNTNNTNDGEGSGNNNTYYRLLSRAQCHLGDLATTLCKGTFAACTLSGAIMPTCTALLPGIVPHGQLVYGTSYGALGTIVQVSNTTFLVMSSIERALLEMEQPLGNFTQTFYREILRRGQDRSSSSLTNKNISYSLNVLNKITDMVKTSASSFQCCDGKVLENYLCMSVKDRKRVLWSASTLIINWFKSALEGNTAVFTNNNVMLSSAPSRTRTFDDLQESITKCNDVLIADALPTLPLQDTEVEAFIVKFKRLY